MPSSLGFLDIWNQFPRIIQDFQRWWCVTPVYPVDPWQGRPQTLPTVAAHATMAIHATKKKSIQRFLDHLQAMIDHCMCKRFHIYYLEHVKIKSDESYDGLHTCICLMTASCDFLGISPAETVQEFEVQHWFSMHLIATNMHLLRLPIYPDQMTECLLKTSHTHIVF